MVKRVVFSGFLLIINVLINIFPEEGFSEEHRKVTVLPFNVFAKESISYLQTEIPGMLLKNLKQDGAEIVETRMATDEAWEIMIQNPDLVRQFGRTKGVDAVIWGSLTYIGKRISLDVNLVSTLSDERVQTFYDDGDGMENLLPVVSKISRQIGTVLFQRKKIVSIHVEGNERIEDDAILRVISSKPGDVFVRGTLSEDLKAIYKMGYFDDIRIDSKTEADGEVVTISVQEKPTIREIIIKGANKAYNTDEIKEALTISAGSIMNVFAIKNNITRIKELYAEKNYHHAEVAYEARPRGKGQIDLEFIIKEGQKIRIKSIVFEGNSAYSDKELKKLMKTKQKGFFSWLTSSGDLKPEDINQDVERLNANYQINGYIQARVGEPQIEYKDDFIYVTIKVDEGPQFKVGTVDFKGDLLIPSEGLLGLTKITKETYCNRKTLHEDQIALTDYYSDNGYANAEIYPRFEKNLEERKVDITFEIAKGKQVYFEKIIINGNTRTRDKVIRRELGVYEQELYSGKRLKRGIRNLYRLDFFEDVKVDTVKGSADDQMILKVDVSEKPTGTFSFGAGYSSQEHMFGTVSVSQRNFLGRSQTLNLKAEFGGTSSRYTFSFTEPWLFDIPLSAGFDLYNWKKDYDYYEKDSIGGGLRFGYPVYDYTRAYLSYSYERSKIKDVAEGLTTEAEGVDRTSSITATLRYDSRDKMFNPTEGSEHSISVEYAGEFLGGDIAFTKYTGESGWYYPLLWKFIGFAHGKIGFVREGTDGRLPDYEKFYLGWMNSVRGFGWRDLHATEEIQIGNDMREIEVGGDKFLQFNVELLYPLFQEAGLVALAFVDTGNVFGTDEEIDIMGLRSSFGYGIRWYSPIGPIRLEWGKIIAPRDGEKKNGSWEFTMGTAF
ncbi:MAG: outer membrane protein assembly factor BamA [Proteobacteria bacterium]|nr:outer membrane protein assembly factor BamA [Pseudomonadota bacterium]